MISRQEKEASVDGIQAYKGDAAPPSTSRSLITGALPAVNPAAVKSTSNYLMALKRRFWAVLAVAVPLAITTSILALRDVPMMSRRNHSG